MEDYMQVENVYVLSNCSKGNKYMAGNGIELKGYSSYENRFSKKVFNFLKVFFSNRKNLEDRFYT